MPGVAPKNPYAAHGPRSPRPTARYSESQPEARGGAVDTDEPVGRWDIDLENLDAVDRASALSFPASDPPALSGPGWDLAVEHLRHPERGDLP